MTAYVAADVAGGLFGPPAFGALMCLPRQWRSRQWFLAWWQFVAGWVMFWCSLSSDWPGTVSAAVSAVVVLWLRWRRPRGPRRAPRSYGEKSLARVRELARTLRRALKPRPALRPVPSPACGAR